ncbi:MAG: alginate export family protein [Roseibacillus sp.]|nr:alginate export family protein [Roseibacillus sp.]
MKKEHTYTLIAAFVLLGGATTASADLIEIFFDEQFSDLEETIPGRFGINERLRYESTDAEGGFDDDGISYRIRYSYTTPDFSGLSGMVEGETLTSIDGGFNTLDRAGLGTEVNQLWAQYADEDYGKIKLGRQIYTLDDHRFIGHVGWRQNIQTFDAVTAVYTGIDKLEINGFYLDQVNRINDTEIDLDAFGINVSYAFAKGHKLTGFCYDIDSAPIGGDASNETLGLRAAGVFSLSDREFTYAASVAEQDFAGGDAGYLAGDLSTVVSGLTLGGGFEILDAGFRTPLATVHSFNGFADKFAGDSLDGGLGSGLEDRYLYAGYEIPVGNGIKTQVIYHWLSPETGAGDGGSELDLVASYAINEYISLVGKYGDYSADDATFGGDKEVFTLELNFVY